MPRAIPLADRARRIYIMNLKIEVFQQSRVPAGHRLIAANAARAVAPLLVTTAPVYNGSSRNRTRLTGTKSSQRSA